MSDTNNELDDLKAQIDLLNDKNRELIGELRTSRAKAKGSEIDPSEYAALQTEVETLRSHINKAEKDSLKAIDGLTKSLTEKDGALQSYLIDNGLNDAMIKAGVKPEFMAATKAMLRAQTEIKADGSNYTALMKEKPLIEAVAEWAASDEGKHFVAAPQNNGSGASGAQGGNGGTSQPKGNLGGDKTQRINALKSRFPDLPV